MGCVRWVLECTMLGIVDLEDVSVFCCFARGAMFMFHTLDVLNHLAVTDRMDHCGRHLYSVDATTSEAVSEGESQRFMQAQESGIQEAFGGFWWESLDVNDGRGGRK